MYIASFFAFMGALVGLSGTVACIAKLAGAVAMATVAWSPLLIVTFAGFAVAVFCQLLAMASMRREFDRKSQAMFQNFHSDKLWR